MIKLARDVTDLADSENIAPPRLADAIYRCIDKAQIPSGFLVSNRQDGCPLGRAGAGAAKKIKASGEAGDIEI